MKLWLVLALLVVIIQCQKGKLTVPYGRFRRLPKKIV